MWHSFKNTLLITLRDPSTIFWVLAFPIIMSLIFRFIFAGVEAAEVFEPIDTAVVAQEEELDHPGFDMFISSIAVNPEAIGGEKSEDGSELIRIHPVVTLAEAEQAIIDGDVTGAFHVVDDEPALLLVPDDGNMVTTYERSILTVAFEEFGRVSATTSRLARENPQLLQDPTFLESLGSSRTFVEDAPILANDVSYMARFYYALLGFGTLMAAGISLYAISALQPNLSTVGARRMLGSIPRWRMLIGTTAGSWLLAFLCLVVAFLFMKYVVDVPFGDRIPEMILGIAIASLMTTTLGSMLGAIPRVSTKVKYGVLTGGAMVFALFAGLFGTPSMDLADSLSNNLPIVQFFNPVKQTSDLFYALYYFDTLERFGEHAVALVAMAVAFSLIAIVFLRRQRYESI